MKIARIGLKLGAGALLSEISPSDESVRSRAGRSLPATHTHTHTHTMQPTQDICFVVCRFQGENNLIRVGMDGHETFRGFRQLHHVAGRCRRELDQLPRCRSVAIRGSQTQGGAQWVGQFFEAFLVGFNGTPDNHHFGGCNYQKATSKWLATLAARVDSRVTTNSTTVTT